jgi:NAD(P)-dependent dehydrogenase (short-subunit alcohol dehydrogenase family)
MSGSLQNRVALVTGGAMGIGQAIAIAAAREGAAVAIGDVSDEGEAVAARITKSGGRALFLRTDVTSTEQLHALAAAANAKFGPVDIAFANAGVEGPLGAPWDCPEKDFARVLDINLIGAWRTMTTVLPGMVERKKGSIVVTSSAAGLVGTGGLAAYVASKHGLVGLVRSVAIDTAKLGVRVNAICPGVIATSLVDRLSAAVPNFEEALLAMKPMARLGTPAEAAEAAIWLASDKASFVTGAMLSVDGGYAAQ